MRYPDGHAEMVQTRYFKPRSKGRRSAQEPINGDPGGLPPQRPPKSPLTPTEVVQAYAKSVNRTRTSIRRTVHAMGADALLTLTYRRNETDRQAAFRDLGRFIRLMRTALGEFLYVAVAEVQKRGAIHFHIAVKGWQDLKLIRRCWAQAGGDGNIDVRKWHGPPHRMASYISKYVTKQITGDGPPSTEHRYRRAQGIAPQTTTIIETSDPQMARQAWVRMFGQAGLIGHAAVVNGDPKDVEFFIWGCTWLDEPEPGGEAT